MGRGTDLNPSFAHKGLSPFRVSLHPPTSVGFAAHAADGLRAAKRPCSPKTSLVAHAPNGYTHGRVMDFVKKLSFIRREARESVCRDLGDEVLLGRGAKAAVEIVADEKFQLQPAIAR